MGKTLDELKAEWPASRITEALAIVASCRGSVLPHTQQPENCKCGELAECPLKKKSPGVTMQDCLRCVTGQDVE